MNKKTQRRGVALVLTLAMLAIATILIVGFAASMRTERQASAAVANSFSTEVLTRSAIDHATALLERNIPQPVGPGTAPVPQLWAVNPGLLTLFGSSGNISVPLSSGAPAPTDPNLNQAELNGTYYNVLGTNAALMRAAWINITRDPSAQPAAANPIMGRYAFWIDDENNKINLNTAFGKPFPNPYPTTGRYARGNPWFTVPVPSFNPAPSPAPPTVVTLGDPASVELGVFAPLSASALRVYSALHPLLLPQDVKQFVLPSSGVTPEAFYQANKSVLSVHNGDPEFNVFGKSRIFVADAMYYPYDYTNSAAGLNTNPYWDTGYAYRSEPTANVALTDPTEPLVFHSYLMNDWNSQGYNGGANGPAATSTSDVAASNPAVAAVTQIANYLNTSWPGHAGSFVSKYGVREAEQIAWNIYGMAAASTTLNTGTTEGAWANTTYRQSYGPANNNMRWSSFLWNGPLNSGARILPQTRSPFVSKIGIGVALTQKDSATPTRRWILDPADPSGTKTLQGTTKYAVAFSISPELYLPSGYQGFRSSNSSGVGQGWNVTGDRVYVTHVEADINGTHVVLASTMDNSALAYDPNGSSRKMLVYSGQVPTGHGNFLDPNASAATANPFDGDRISYTNTTPDMTTGDRAEGTNFTPGAAWGTAKVWDATAFPTATIANIRIRFVAVTPSGTGTNPDLIPYQISPIRDIDHAPGFEPGTAVAGAIVFPTSLTVSTTGGYASAGGAATWGCMETTDPRVNQLATDWHPSPHYGTPSGQSDLGVRSSALGMYPATSPAGDESKLAFPDNSQFTMSGFIATHRGGRPHDTDKRMSSVGWLSCISTGIQSGVPWRTLKFQPGGGGSPPDWLLMDLFAVPFATPPRIVTATNPVTSQKTTTTYSYPVAYDGSGQAHASIGVPMSLTYMNSTAGKVNLNAIAYPMSNTSFAPPLRTLALQALLENIYQGGNQITSLGTGASSSSTLATNIAQHQLSVGGVSTTPYLYSGELCEVAGIADNTTLNEWDREAIVRNLASLVTTRSNVFTVWGVAQTVKKSPPNLAKPGALFGAFEDGDQVTGERRFRAVIERYVWPGVDGVVGNGQANTNGYSQLGANAWLASPTNAASGTNPSAPGFEALYNPQVAVMRYRVRSITYLTD